MEEIFGKLARVIAVMAVLSALATVAYTLCYSNVTIYYADGSTQSCSTFCVFSGGWLCR